MSQVKDRNDAAVDWVRGELMRRGNIQACPNHEENLIDKAMLSAEDLAEEFDEDELPSEITDKKDLIAVIDQVLGDAAEECGACGAT
jgi:Asp-tRNA(Asn)/Glu-tRNA(Gln) amidotransferase B subunit